MLKFDITHDPDRQEDPIRFAFNGQDVTEDIISVQMEFPVGADPMVVLHFGDHLPVRSCYFTTVRINNHSCSISPEAYEFLGTLVRPGGKSVHHFAPPSKSAPDGDLEYPIVGQPDPDL